ncbi:AEC family transporter [Phormidium tenue FACHB-886]|nr:AEC family transporter [Phormidium tenue FACHB-886]
MADSLVQAYFPLFLWTGLGFLLLRFLPESLPRLLGRGLYWVGVPLEILALARQTHFSAQVGLAPAVVIAALVVGLLLAWLGLQAVRYASSEPSAAEPASPPDAVENAIETALGLTAETADLWESRARRGSFILAAIIGNTGFVGLAIAPTFVDQAYASWLVFYSVAHNVVGTYGVGVFLASFYGRSLQKHHWWKQVRDVLTVPSLWAFVVGSTTQPIALPALAESGLQASVGVVIPAALLLMGMRISQLHGWKSLRLAIIPAVLKVVVLPGLVGLLVTALGVMDAARLALVLMAGMPSAFAGLILAEEYELDRELIASSIVLSTGLLLVMIPIWLAVFG